HSDFTVAEAAAQRVYDLVREMKLPQQLRLVGVSENDLPRLAQLALTSRTIKNNPKPITDAAQIESVLRAAW
ncbi:MAG TPA: iron-containing alcohol dehydrogenase, partial [Anaerolineae bacterium]